METFQITNRRRCQVSPQRPFAGQAAHRCVQSFVNFFGQIWGVQIHLNWYSENKSSNEVVQKKWTWDPLPQKGSATKYLNRSEGEIHPHFEQAVWWNSLFASVERLAEYFGQQSCDTGVSKKHVKHVGQVSSSFKWAKLQFYSLQWDNLQMVQLIFSRCCCEHSETPVQPCSSHVSHQTKPTSDIDCTPRSFRCFLKCLIVVSYLRSLLSMSLTNKQTSDVELTILLGSWLQQ